MTLLCRLQDGQTPLHLAAENDHSDVIKLFLKHKPDLVTMANTVSYAVHRHQALICSTNLIRM